MFLNFFRRTTTTFKENNFNNNTCEVEVAEEAETQEQTLLKESIYGKCFFFRALQEKYNCSYDYGRNCNFDELYISSN